MTIENNKYKGNVAMFIIDSPKFFLNTVTIKTCEFRTEPLVSPSFVNSRGTRLYPDF